MFVYYDSIMISDEKEKERNNEIKIKLIDYSERESKNMVYINERWSVKYKTIKNVDSIRKSKNSECKEEI